MQTGRFLLISILYFSLSFLIGCPEKKELKPESIVTVYMGDPEDVMKGTSGVDRIPEDFFADGEILYLQKQIEFVSRKSYDRRDKLTATEAAVEPSTHLGGDLKNGTSFVAAKVSENQLTISARDFSFNLEKREDGSYKISSVKKADREISVQFLHFSVTGDNRTMSFLLLDPSKEKSITAFYFARYDVTAKPAEYISAKYNYTFGAGVKVRWAKTEDLNISACQGFNSTSTLELTESLRLWTEELGANLKVQLVPAGTLRPISDLNQKCISIIDGYMTSPRPDYMVSGITYLTADFESHTFVDGDILIFKSEYTKRRDFNGSALSRWRRRTFIHELGHFFGLDHQFVVSPSIMSYDESLENQLYFYDQQALRTLYAD